MKDYIFKKYNSIGEFSASLKNAKIQKPFEGSPSSISGTYSFCMSNSYDEADNLLLYGDRDLQRRIEEADVARMRMRIKYEGIRRQTYSSVVGFAPNVPAYLAGTPNSMINVRKVKTAKRVVTIMYNSSVSACVSSESIIEATAKMLSAIMLVEASGVRVNVYVGELTKCRGTQQKFGWILRIKDSGQKLDTLKMSYPLAHPSMLRRHAFRALETAEGVDRAYAEHGYGQPVSDEKESRAFLKACSVCNIDKILCYSNISGKSAEDIAKMITGEAK